MASEKSKRKVSNVEGTPFMKYDLDNDNPEVIRIIQEKDVYPTTSLKVLLKPAIEKAIRYVIIHVFQKYPYQIAMEQRHDFILIDSEYPSISSTVHNIDGLFETDSQIDYTKIQRNSNFLLACQLDLSDFEFKIQNGYYFFFMINRDVLPLHLLFLGYFFNDNPENVKKTIYVDSLSRTATNLNEVESDLSKRKKQKGEYAKRAILLSSFEEKLIF